MALEESVTTPPVQPSGLLVPVANPEGVAPLISIALAAHEAHDPAPRVLALVRRPPDAAAPQPAVTPALSAAVDLARAQGVTINPRAVWTDDPARDIVAHALQSQVEWVILGYHRAESGDTLGGVVRGVFEQSERAPHHVGVFIQGTDQPIERVFVAVDTRADGRASLDLALRIARNNQRSLFALLVKKRMPQHEDELADMVSAARRGMNGRMHADVLSKRSLNQLMAQTPGRLLIVPRNLADELGLQLHEAPQGGRNLVVVQGAERA